MTTMKSLFILLLSTAIISTASAQQCEAPSTGCTYGMFNYEKCECECIQPFCPDSNGDCVVPLDNCGGNPWEGCTRGLDCPWWGSLSSGDMCNTGSKVPPGVWAIYNTRAICCGVHSPFSTVCNLKGPNPPNNIPSSEPTIALQMPNEKVTLKFDLNGLPNDFDMTKVKANVLTGLKIILSQLKVREPGLQISGINERSCNGRRLIQQRQLRMVMVERELLTDASICYTVEVENRDSGQDYEALLVTEARASSDVVLDEIRTKLNYVNVGMNTGGENGNGSDGSSGSSGSNSNGGSNPTTMNNGNGGSGDGGGLPGWAVALIVILFLVLSCCIGYCIFASVRNSKDEKGDINILFNNPVRPTGNSSSRGNHPSRSKYGSAPRRRQRSFVAKGSRALRQSFSRRPNRSRNERDRPRRRDDRRRRRHNRYGGFRSSVTDRVRSPRRSRGDRSRRDDDNEYPSISLSNPQDPKFSADELTVNTYTTNKKIEQDPPMNALVVYEPDYAKPDPDGETAGAVVLALTNGEDSTRNYAGGPITKPKLEPEEILSTATPRETSDPSVAPQPVLYGVSGDASDDEEEYDQYGFRRDQPQIYAPKRQNKRSEELEDSLSFATEDPEDERRRARKSRKKKKKKAKGRGDSSHSSKRYEESNYFTPESSEREKAYRQYSGVDSVESEVGSIELESRASA
mmetsp:Transcript_7231/g.11027  ORF Transcript_7231/g.11027 Transcript_7231/m.11027 type:complete len:687 (+) Transcript_7231:204-2264(+)